MTVHAIALDQLTSSEQVPDVALIDWNMTTESEQSQIVRALAAGADEYLIKPFTPGAVAQKLELLGLTAGV